MVRLPRSIALLSALLTSTVSFHAWAAVLVVPTDYPTIQAAVTAAADSDTVLVRPGVYVESVSWSGKDLTLIAASDLVEITTHGAARVLSIGPGGAAGSRLEGFAITEGRAERGAGLMLGPSGRVQLARCRFVGNQAFSTTVSVGGGIYADGGSVLVVEDCVFRNNAALIDQLLGLNGVGGAIGTSDSRLTVERSIFERNIAQGFEGGPGGAIAGEGGGGDIESSYFVKNAGGSGGAIAARGCWTVAKCVFHDNQSGYGASAIVLTGECLPSPQLAGSGARIVGNQFYDNWTPFGGIVEASGPVEVESNTIAFNNNGAGIALQNGANASLNIVAFNQGPGIQCLDAGHVLRCNDVYLNSGGNYSGGCPDPTGTAGNISLDPLFCNGVDRKLAIAEQSPCAPGQTDCGLIGALGVGCNLNGVGDRLAGDGVRFLAPSSNPGSFPVRLRFQLGKATPVRLVAYDISGRKLAVIADRAFESGPHEVVWTGRVENGRDAAPGVYLIALMAGGVRQSQRLVIIQ